MSDYYDPHPGLYMTTVELDVDMLSNYRTTNSHS